MSGRSRAAGTAGSSGTGGGDPGGGVPGRSDRGRGAPGSKTPGSKTPRNEKPSGGRPGSEAAAGGDGRSGRGERRRLADAGDGTGEPADPQAVARLICLRLLTAAPRTRAELAEALRRRRVPADAAEAVLSRFAEVKLIDDAMFAQAWVESRHHGRGLAGRALAAELGRRGVARSDIKVAVDQLTPDTELATARELVARKLDSTRGMPGAARVRRLAGLLARKGYGAGLTYRVVREALEQDGQNLAAAGLDGDEPLGLGLDGDGSFGPAESEVPFGSGLDGDDSFGSGESEVPFGLGLDADGSFGSA